MPFCRRLTDAQSFADLAVRETVDNFDENFLLPRGQAFYFFGLRMTVTTKQLSLEIRITKGSVGKKGTVGIK